MYNFIFNKNIFLLVVRRLIIVTPLILTFSHANAISFSELPQSQSYFYEIVHLDPLNKLCDTENQSDECQCTHFSALVQGFSELKFLHIPLPKPHILLSLQLHFFPFIHPPQ